jgi:hypothetical protein
MGENNKSYGCKRKCHSPTGRIPLFEDNNLQLNTTGPVDPEKTFDLSE